MNPYKMHPRGRKPHKERSERQHRRMRHQSMQSIPLASEAVAADHPGVESPTGSSAGPIRPCETTPRCNTRNPVTVGRTSSAALPQSSSIIGLTSASESIEVTQSVNTMEDAAYMNETNSDSDLPYPESMTSRDEDSDTPTDEDMLNPKKEGSYFRRKLASYIVKHGLSRQASDDLLALLGSHKCFASLPKSSKTLLGTPRQPPTLIEVHPGQYLHLGFELAIISIIETMPQNCLPSTLEIDVSTDGATLGKETRQIWPIQCRIANIENRPVEIIGVYRGQGKPTSAMDFLRPFVHEANRIICDGGVLYLGNRKPIMFRAFIADAPARAFILNHMGHNASNPCSKCKITGVYTNGRMALLGVNHVPRTDEEYLRQDDENHHKDGVSPLSLLPISMVSQVPFEYMHLVCIGCMKRVLLTWVDGKLPIPCKLSAHEIHLISTRLDLINGYCPKEFARRPRSLVYYHHYKATEFRQLLLYTGPVVFKGILRDKYYKHFLLLHTAMRILSSVCPTEEQLHYARLALELFVRRCETLYGAEFVSYNIHGLLHLVDDSKLLGPLDSFSAFPYENNMMIFRKYCKKPHLQLAQIANRRAEKELCLNKNDCVQNWCDSPVLLGKHTNGPLLDDTTEREIGQYRCVKCRNFTLSTRVRDRSCILNDYSICLVENIVLCNNEIHLIVKKFNSVTAFYDVPIACTSYGYYKCSEVDEELTIVRLDDVSSKGYLTPTWLPRQFDQNGKELIEDGQFVVAAMPSKAYY